MDLSASSGKVAGKYKGTVFTNARVELAMSQKDPAVRKRPAHLQDALNHPERIFPSPLHRLINKGKQQANRNRSIKECEKGPLATRSILRPEEIHTVGPM
ncbi:hypothetical protein [Streptomyces mirabilis]|uniref:hypothetical protein n=1 Tax=Streptomyces mirabilis TaxID=68239 RepID=UPI00331AFC8E